MDIKDGQGGFPPSGSAKSTLAHPMGVQMPELQPGPEDTSSRLSGQSVRGLPTPVVTTALSRRIGVAAATGRSADDAILVRTEGTGIDVIIDHQYAKAAARWLFSDEFYAHIAVRALYFANDPQADVVDQLFVFVDKLPDEYNQASRLRVSDDPQQRQLTLRGLPPNFTGLFQSRPEDVEPLRQAVFAYELLAMLFTIHSTMVPKPVQHQQHQRLISFFKTNTFWWNVMLRNVSSVTDRAQAFNDGRMANIQQELGWVMQGAESTSGDFFDFSVTYVRWLARATRIATQERAAKLVYEHHLGSNAVQRAREDLLSMWRAPDLGAIPQAEIETAGLRWNIWRRALLPFLPKVYYDFMQSRVFPKMVPKEMQGLDILYWVNADRKAAKWMQEALVHTDKEATAKTKQRGGRRIPYRKYRCGVETDHSTDDEPDIEWTDQTLETLWTDMVHEPIIAYTVEQFFGHSRVYKESFYDNVVRVSQEMMGMWLIGCCLFTFLQFEKARFTGLDDIEDEIQKFIDIAPPEIRVDNEMVKLMVIAVTINTRTLDEAGEVRVLDNDRARAAVAIATKTKDDMEVIKGVMKEAMHKLKNKGKGAEATAPEAYLKQAKDRKALKKKKAGKGEGKHEKGTEPEADKLPPAESQPLTEDDREAAEEEKQRVLAGKKLSETLKTKKRDAAQEIKEFKVAPSEALKADDAIPTIDLTEDDESATVDEEVVPPPPPADEAKKRRKKKQQDAAQAGGGGDAFPAISLSADLSQKPPAKAAGAAAAAVLPVVPVSVLQVPAPAKAAVVAPRSASVPVASDSSAKKVVPLAPPRPSVSQMQPASTGTTVISQPSPRRRVLLEGQMQSFGLQPDSARDTSATPARSSSTSGTPTVVVPASPQPVGKEAQEGRTIPAILSFAQKIGSLFAPGETALDAEKRATLEKLNREANLQQIAQNTPTKQYPLFVPQTPSPSQGTPRTLIRTLSNLTFPGSQTPSNANAGGAVPLKILSASESSPRNANDMQRARTAAPAAGVGIARPNASTSAGQQALEDAAVSVSRPQSAPAQTLAVATAPAAAAQPAVVAQPAVPSVPAAILGARSRTVAGPAAQTPVAAGKKDKSDKDGKDA